MGKFKEMETREIDCNTLALELKAIDKKGFLSLFYIFLTGFTTLYILGPINNPPSIIFGIATIISGIFTIVNYRKYDAMYYNYIADNV